MAACFSLEFFAAVSGTATTVVLFVCGILTLISLHALCWAVGVYMMCSTFVVGMMEIPFLFKCFAWSETMTKKLEPITPLQRAVFYLGMSVFLFFCIGVGTIIAALLLITTAFIYGMIWLGPRGRDAEEKKNAAESKRASKVVNGDDEEQLIGGDDNTFEIENEEDVGAGNRGEAFPWDKFMNTVATNQAAAISAAAVNHVMTGSTIGSTDSNLAVGSQPAGQPATTMTGEIPSSHRSQPMFSPTENPFEKPDES